MLTCLHCGCKYKLEDSTAFTQSLYCCLAHELLDEGKRVLDEEAEEGVSTDG